MSVGQGAGRHLVYWGLVVGGTVPGLALSKATFYTRDIYKRPLLGWGAVLEGLL